MKLLVLTTSFPLTTDSISGIFIKRLLENMPEDVKITVLTPATRHPISTTSTLVQIKTFSYAPSFLQHLAHEPGGIVVALKQNKLNYTLLPFFFLAMLIACINAAFRNDLIHANWSMNGVIAGLAGFLTGTPVITTLRGADIERIATSTLQYRILQLCLLLSKRIVTVSEAIRQKVSLLYPKSAHKIDFIPNGVEKRFLEVASIARPDPKHFMVVGSLIKRKGVDIILRAIAELPDLEGIRLSIVGDGPELNNLKQLSAALEIDEKMSWHASIPPEEIPRLIKTAGIFLMASYSEGRSNALLEAMAAELTIISSDIEGVQELITDGKSGLLFEAGNYQQLSEKIRILLNDEELRMSLARNAKNFIIDSRLSWSESARKYFSLYNNIVS